MDRSRRQRTALQIAPSTAATGAACGQRGAGITPDPTPSQHLVIRLQPRSRRDAVRGERDGAVLIALQAPPVDGAANAALLRFLAAQLRLPQNAMSLVRGASSRLKWVSLDGMTAAEARQRLLALQQTGPAAPA